MEGNPRGAGSIGRCAAVVTAALALAGTLASDTARAAEGDLAFSACLEDTAGLSADLFRRRRDDRRPQRGRPTALSPDGENLYAAGITDDSIVTFARNRSTDRGADLPRVRGRRRRWRRWPRQHPRPRRIPGRPALVRHGIQRRRCRRFHTRSLHRKPWLHRLPRGHWRRLRDLHRRRGTLDGLNDPFGLAISPDGRHVYVSGGGDNAIAAFSRNQSTGVLTFVGCLEDTGGPSGCPSTAASTASTRHARSRSPGRQARLRRRERRLRALPRSHATRPRARSGSSAASRHGRPLRLSEHERRGRAQRRLRRLGVGRRAAGLRPRAQTDDSIAVFLAKREPRVSRRSLGSRTTAWRGRRARRCAERGAVA